MYIWGGVGTGKTMLMNRFFESAKQVPLRRRLHLHDFMLDVHERVHTWKQQRIEKIGRNLHLDQSPEGDALHHVAASIASECQLLALDEFVVNDVADALNLRHLFSTMWSYGTVLVATSNIEP